MNTKSRFVCLFISILLFFNGLASANLVFKMDADNYTLTIGQEATIGFWVNIEEQTTGLNGLNMWQLDMVVDNDNVISVTDVNILQPALPDLDPWVDPYFSINTALSGNVFGMGAAALNPPKDSSVGVGGFTLLAYITIEAIGVGDATYDLAGDTYGFSGYLRDFDWDSWQDVPGTNVYDSIYAAPYKAVFQTGNNVFTVVPEPGSLVIMAVMAGFALRNRRVSVRK